MSQFPWKTWLSAGVLQSAGQPKDPNAAPPGKRNPSPTAVPSGETAITRAQAEAERLAKLTPAPPPSATAAASTATEAARVAAERQRKRAAGGSLLVGGAKLQPGPVARLSPRTLLGGGGY